MRLRLIMYVSYFGYFFCFKLSVFIYFFLLLLRLSGNDKHNFAAWLGCSKLIDEFAERTAVDCLVKFGDFSTDGGIAVGAECLGKLLKRFEQPQRALVDDNRSRLFGKLSNPRCSALFLR